MKHVAALCILGGVWLCPAAARACHEITVCLEWEAVSVDSDPTAQHEDFAIGETIPARGARITLIPPPPEQALDRFLGEDGCFAFQTDYTTGFKLLAHSEARLGAAGGILIQAYNSLQDRTDDVRYTTAIHLNSVSPGETVTISLPIAEDAFNLLAWSAFAVYQIDSQSDPRLPGASLMRIAQTTDGSAANAINVNIRDSGIDRKFLIAHETGHWLQFNSQSFKTIPPFDYGYPTSEALCEFVALTGGSSHGIRSSEWSGGALLEGFAQFMSTLAFNDPAEDEAFFKYYKEIDLDAVPGYQEFVDAGSYVSLAGGDALDTLGGQGRWVQNMCPVDWADPDGEVTSEIDWMRFFWQFLAKSDPDLGAKPTVKDVIRTLTYPHDEQMGMMEPWTAISVWGALLMTFDDMNSGLMQFKDRFQTLGTQNGVAH